MTTKTSIRDFYGHILGFVYEDEKGNKKITDFYGRIVAKYNKITNKTTDFYGHIIGQGDMGVSLLYKGEKR